MKLTRVLVAMVALPLLLVAGCSGDDSSPSTTQVEIGTPDPPIPSEVNALPFTVGALAAAGNAEVSMKFPDDAQDVPEGYLVLDVTVTSGALEPFTITPEMFRVYTVDGRSYTPVAVGDIAQFGNVELATKQSYSALLAVEIATDSEPALFLADFTDLGERFFAVAFSLDPDFVPVAPEE